MSHYQIRFTAGENPGFCFPLSPGQVVHVGRSSKSTIQLEAPDVSGKHLAVRIDSFGKITLEVFSAHITKLNGNDIAMGTMVGISDGASVQMGKNTTFVVESVEDAAPTDSADDSEGDVATNYPGSTPIRPAIENGGWDEPPAASASNSTSLPGTVAASAPPVWDAPESATPAPEAPTNAAYAESESVTEQREMEDPNATAVQETRMADTDVVDNIKKADSIRHLKKVIFISAPIILVLSVTVFLYFYLKPKREEFITWPTEQVASKEDGAAKGTTAFINGYYKLSSYLYLKFPGVEGYTVKDNGPDTEVNTRTGKLLDVPLRILATSEKNPATLELDHSDAFNLWKERMEKKDATLHFINDWTTNAVSTRVFIGISDGAGVPITYIAYTRRVGSDDFTGYAVFLRNADVEHTIMVEVPSNDKDRSEYFMHVQLPNMVGYFTKMVEKHWEGTSSYRRNTSVENDLKEADAYMRHGSPDHWAETYECLISALIKSAKAENPDAEQVDEAIRQLGILRQQMTVWYNQKYLAVEQASIDPNRSDRATIESIQKDAMNMFKERFKDADFRYDYIRHQNWTWKRNQPR